MNSSVTQPSLPTPLLLADVPVRMAKTSLRLPEQRAKLGRVVQRVMVLSGLNLQEFAKAVGRDERQVYRWINGTERQQLEAIYAAPELSAHLVIALAETVPSVEVKTTITVSRIA